MQFYVLHQGQRYGPADLPTLNQWAADGRILSHTTLEEVATGRTYLASQLPGLHVPNFHQPQQNFQPPGPGAGGISTAPYQPGGPAQFSQNPYSAPNPYNPASYDLAPNPHGDLLLGWGLLVASFFCCPYLCALFAIWCGVQANRKRPGAGNVLLVASVIALIVSFLLQGTMLNLGRWIGFNM